MTAQYNLLTLTNMEIRHISIPVATENVNVANQAEQPIAAHDSTSSIKRISHFLLRFLSKPFKLAKKVLNGIFAFPYKVRVKLFHLSTMRNNYALKTSEKHDSKSGDWAINDKNKKRFSVKNIARAALLLIIATGLIIGGKKLLGNTNIPNKNDTSAQKQSVLGARATQDINRDFEFPVKDDNGVKVASFKYTIESAELRDQIIVKGQTATAVNGRTFLLINLKITNDKDKPININTRDYIRLSVNGNQDEWLAPDIHNDSVEVQAISTKYTRVGFPINTSDKNLVLRVGEIDGEKQDIQLNLK